VVCWLLKMHKWITKGLTRSPWCVHLILSQKMYYCVKNNETIDCQQHMNEVGGSLLGSARHWSEMIKGWKHGKIYTKK
jgi:hypothetical protein